MAQTGAIEVEDVVAGWKLVTELLRPIGMAICEHIDAEVAGFTYIVYQPRAHRAGHQRYLYAGTSMRHPLSHDGLAEFGSTAVELCRLETAAGAVRFVIATTGKDIGLLTRLKVAEDPRFWNQQDGSAPASDWTFAPAGAIAQPEPLTV